MEGARGDGGCEHGRREGETAQEGPEGANEDSQVRVGQSRDSRSP